MPLLSRNHFCRSRRISTCGPQAVGWIPLALLLTGFSIAPTDAKVIFEGEPDEVSLSAEDAPVVEVLSALLAQFSVTVPKDLPVPDPDRRIDGAYTGTLRP